MGDVATSRILIADDEPLFLRTTAELLRKEGFDCTCASNGAAALERSRPRSLIWYCPTSICRATSNWSC